MVNDNCMITKNVIHTIRHYVSAHSQGNKVLCVHEACLDITKQNNHIKIPQDILMQIISREAIALGMVLQFHDGNKKAKEILLPNVIDKNQ